MSVLDGYDAEQRVAIGAGSVLGIGGFAVWVGLEMAILGLPVLLAGGLVAGTGSVGFKPGVRDGAVAMVATLAGGAVVMTLVSATRAGYDGMTAVAVGVLGTLLLLVVLGAVVFGPFVLLGGAGGWIRETVSGPVEDDGDPSPGDEVGNQDDDSGDGEPDDGTDWQRVEEV